MVKSHSQYVCQSCGYESSKWLGRCLSCGEWNTFVETLVETPTSSKHKSSGKFQTPKKLDQIKLGKTSRISTKISELDRVLGSGLVKGQVVLLAGEPGIGKSTLLLQLTNNLDQTLYVSGEESASQIKIRADRLGVKKKSVQILESVDIDNIINTVKHLTSAKEKLSAVIVDSIQTMSTGDLSGMAGSVGQVRECAYRLVNLAKSKDIPIFIVGHVTKAGNVAGPSVLAHLVDTVLWFEGDKSSLLRVLRVNKNRFGPTDEVGVFEMKEQGLVSVEDASSIFVTDKTRSVPGSCIASILEGTRPILAEIQSLVVPTKLAYPRRVVQGIDARRSEIILAILSRRVGLPINENDVFVNVVGGISISEPGVDLSLAMSLASAYFNKPLPKKTLAIGEVDLLGEIREVPALDRRIKEARRLGYKTIISSKDFTYLGQAIRTYLR